MRSGFEKIKYIYDCVLKQKDICDRHVFQAYDFIEHIEASYDKAIRDYYGIYGYCSYFEINKWNLRDLILEVIYSNLYSELVIMSQNLVKKKYNINREVFLTLVECNKNLDVEVSQKCRERFRRRMQNQRLNVIDKFKFGEKDEYTFYSPTIIRAFKEVWFIKRKDSGIFDISKNYIELFYTLMFDEDDYLSPSEAEKKRRHISNVKSYHMWNFGEDEVALIFKAYENVLNGYLGGDKIAQLNLLDKLFGINTIAELFAQNKSETKYIAAIKELRCLSYTSLHKLLIDKLTSKNYKVIKSFVITYLVPLCIRVWSNVIKDIIFSLEDKDDEQRAAFIEKLLIYVRKKFTFEFSSLAFQKLKKTDDSKIINAIMVMNSFNNVRRTRELIFNILKNSIKDFDDEYYNPKKKKRRDEITFKEYYYDLYSFDVPTGVNLDGRYSECLFDKSLVDLMFYTIYNDESEAERKYHKYCNKKELESFYRRKIDRYIKSITDTNGLFLKRAVKELKTLLKVRSKMLSDFEKETSQK